MKNSMWFVGISLSALLLAACGSSAEKEVEKKAEQSILKENNKSMGTNGQQMDNGTGETNTTGDAVKKPVTPETDSNMMDTKPAQ